MCNHYYTVVNAENGNQTDHEPLGFFLADEIRREYENQAAALSALNIRTDLWGADSNHGMRYMEDSDTSGGETDCHHAKVANRFYLVRDDGKIINSKAEYDAEAEISRSAMQLNGRFAQLAPRSTGAL